MAPSHQKATRGSKWAAAQQTDEKPRKQNGPRSRIRQHSQQFGGVAQEASRKVLTLSRRAQEALAGQTQPRSRQRKPGRSR